MNMTLLQKYKIPAALILFGALVFLLLPYVTSANDGFVSTAMSVLEGVLYNFVIIVFGGFARISGIMLDFAINEAVIGFGNLYITNGIGSTIDSLWVIVRDIFNLTFIFGLVSIGLRLIFDSSSSSARKTLISLILAALLVNFSLFITKFIVDFSNIAAVQLVNTFESGEGGAKISASFMQIFGATSLLGDAPLTQLVSSDGGFGGFRGGSGMLYVFGTMIILLIISFVFMAGAVLLLIRFVALNLYMLLSPLMFAGMVFPAASRITQEFWSGFLGKAFFAPAYILMLYFSYQILATFQVTGGGNLAAGLTSGKTIVVQEVWPPFILGAIFLIASLVVAQKMGATGANGAISMGKMLAGKATGYARKATGAATFGAGAVLAQRTVGYGANKVAGGRLRDAASKNWAAKQALRAANKLGDSSFDARNAIDINLGKGIKGGYNSRIEEQKKADVAFAKLLGERDPKDAPAAERAMLEASILKKKIGAKDAAQSALTTAEAAYQAKQNELTAPLAGKIEALEKQLAAAKLLSPDLVPALEEEIAAKKAQVAKILEDNSIELAPLKAAFDVAKKAHQAAEAALAETQKNIDFEVNAAIKFSRQMAYIEKRQQDATGWLGRAYTASGGGSGLLAGAAIGAGVGMLGTATGVGIIAAHTISEIDQESVDNLKKIYGENGINLAKKEKRVKRIKEELAAKKDDQEDPEEGKEEKK